MLMKHKKSGGVYQIVALQINEADMVPVVAYANVDGGPIWVRPAAEFFDGRFEVYTPAKVAPDGGYMQ